MDIDRSDIVRASAGRDEGKLFFVVDTDGEYLLLADGKTRRLEKPKRKKRRHVEFYRRPECRVGEKIKQRERLSNSELRRTLAELSGDGHPDQEGRTLG